MSLARIHHSFGQSFSLLGVCLSSLGGLAAMVFALWMWQHAARLADIWIGYGDSVGPDVAKWAFRSGAVAIASIAQGVLVVIVWGRLYGRQLLDTVARVTIVLVFAIAAISATVLLFAAR